MSKSTGPYEKELKVVGSQGEIKGAEEEEALNKIKEKKILRTTYGREGGLFRLDLEI